MGGSQVINVGNLLEQALAAAPALILHRVIAQFEDVVGPLPCPPEQVADVEGAIRTTDHDRFARFRSAVDRNAFLVAAYRHLAEIGDHEELLVAFGRHLGTGDEAPSWLEGLWRGVGERGRVGLTPNCRHQIDKLAGVMPNAEIVLIHNHPHHDLKSLLHMLFGWRPLPSSDDRHTALGFNFGAAVASLLGTPTTFRFYIVDDRELSQFYLPSVELFIRLFEESGLVKRGVRPYVEPPP